MSSMDLLVGVVEGTNRDNQEVEFFFVAKLVAPGREPIVLCQPFGYKTLEEAKEFSTAFGFEFSKALVDDITGAKSVAVMEKHSVGRGPKEMWEAIEAGPKPHLSLVKDAEDLH